MLNIDVQIFVYNRTTLSFRCCISRKVCSYILLCPNKPTRLLGNENRR